MNQAASQIIAVLSSKSFWAGVVAIAVGAWQAHLSPDPAAGWSYLGAGIAAALSIWGIRHAVAKNTAQVIEAVAKGAADAPDTGEQANPSADIDSLLAAITAKYAEQHQAKLDMLNQLKPPS